MKSEILEEELLQIARDFVLDLEHKVPHLDEAFEIRIRPNNGILKEYNGEAEYSEEFSKIDELRLLVSVEDILTIVQLLRKYHKSL